MICTYAHYKPDNTIFYIGIGNVMRPYDFQKRNDYWKNIVAKYGKPRVQILAEWGTAEEAKQHEIVLIDCFKSMGYQLANLTNGGDGCNGYKHTEEHKQKMSDRFKGNKNPMYGRYGDKNPGYGKGHLRSKEKHPQFKGSIECTNILNGEKIIVTAIKEMQNAGFSPSKVYACANGTRKKHKGYTFRRLEI